MQAGQLTERILIQKKQGGYDAIGQPINEWVELMECWSDVQHLSGLSTIKADAVTSVTKASMRIRKRAHRPMPRAGMRVLYNGLVYDIRAVLPNRKHHYLDLLVETNGATA